MQERASRAILPSAKPQTGMVRRTTPLELHPSEIKSSQETAASAFGRDLTEWCSYGAQKRQKASLTASAHYGGRERQFASE